MRGFKKVFFYIVTNFFKIFKAKIWTASPYGQQDGPLLPFHSSKDLDIARIWGISGIRRADSILPRFQKKSPYGTRVGETGLGTSASGPAKGLGAQLQNKKIAALMAAEFPDGRDCFISRAVRIEEVDGGVVIEGKDDHFAEVFDLITAFAVDGDELVFCHFEALLS